MRRDALLYGLWAVLCFLLTSLAVYVVTGNDLRETTGLLKESSSIAVALFAVAGVGWAILHRDGRQPGRLGYCLLAVAVTLIVNFVFIGVMFSNTPSAPGPQNLDKYLTMVTFALIIHGWFTIPIALVATWLFVRWLLPRARPSGPSRARSRS